MGSELTPLFLKNIQNLRDYIKSAVPFKLDERMAAVNNLEEKFKAEQIPPVKALAIMDLS